LSHRPSLNRSPDTAESTFYQTSLAFLTRHFRRGLPQLLQPHQYRQHPLQLAVEVHPVACQQLQLVGLQRLAAGGFLALSPAPGQFLLKDVVLLAASICLVRSSIAHPIKDLHGAPTAFPSTNPSGLASIEAKLNAHCLLGVRESEFSKLKLQLRPGCAFDKVCARNRG
jgi:hypothetical protein